MVIPHIVVFIKRYFWSYGSIDCFREFYYDIVPELRGFGELISVRVCNNHTPHLRGNVYVQYLKEYEAVCAYNGLHGRWYGGRQLTLTFADIENLKLAVCGKSGCLYIRAEKYNIKINCLF